MAKKPKAADSVADQIAAFIGRSMGELVNRKESLAREMAEVESQISDVRDRVSRQFGQLSHEARKGGRAVKSAVSRVRRELSPATRAKMAKAARKRWAKAKKAGLKRLG